MGEHIIELKDLNMVFDDHYQALKHINLYINKNEFLTLLGPSGCGKTTTLRCIGGFERPTSGEIFFKGKNIVDLPPYKRNINTVFQRYALFPHMKSTKGRIPATSLPGSSRCLSSRSLARCSTCLWNCRWESG